MISIPAHSINLYAPSESLQISCIKCFTHGKAHPLLMMPIIQFIKRTTTAKSSLTLIDFTVKTMHHLSINHQSIFPWKWYGELFPHRPIHIKGRDRLTISRLSRPEIESFSCFWDDHWVLYNNGVDIHRQQNIKSSLYLLLKIGRRELQHDCLWEQAPLAAYTIYCLSYNPSPRIVQHSPCYLNTRLMLLWKGSSHITRRSGFRWSDSHKMAVRKTPNQHPFHERT